MTNTIHFGYYFHISYLNIKNWNIQS